MGVAIDHSGPQLLLQAQVQCCPRAGPVLTSSDSELATQPLPQLAVSVSGTQEQRQAPPVVPTV